MRERDLDRLTAETVRRSFRAPGDCSQQIAKKSWRKQGATYYHEEYQPGLLEDFDG